METILKMAAVVLVVLVVAIFGINMTPGTFRRSGCCCQEVRYTSARQKQCDCRAAGVCAPKTVWKRWEEELLLILAKADFSK